MLQIAQSFVLEKTSEGYQLKRSHAYYFQVCVHLYTVLRYILVECIDVLINCQLFASVITCVISCRYSVS
jgi:hypothetical protein